LHYGRSKTPGPRAAGAEAFRHFAIDIARLKAREHRSACGALTGARGLPLGDAERAVDRWYAEGGNTETRLPRRARRA
jgi:hypothetical protein